MYLQYFVEEGLNEIEYPVNPVDIQKIENPLNISINGFTDFNDVGKARHPMYISRHKNLFQIDLLCFNGHYAWIKTISRLFKDVTLRNHQNFFCKLCLGHFKIEKLFERHNQLCTR